MLEYEKYEIKFENEWLLWAFKRWFLDRGGFENFSDYVNHASDGEVIPYVEGELQDYDCGLQIREV